MKTGILLLSTFLILAETSQPGEVCPFVFLGHKCYKFVTDGFTRDKPWGYGVCKKHGLDELELETLEEFNIISNYIGHHHPTVRNWRVFGANKVSKWQWSDGSQINANMWINNNPATHRYGSSMLLTKIGKTSYKLKGGWTGSKANYPSYSYPFICEKPGEGYGSCYAGDLKQYDGTVDKTADGKTCLKWSEFDGPATIQAALLAGSKSFPGGKIPDHNYCRTPDIPALKAQLLGYQFPVCLISTKPFWGACLIKECEPCSPGSYSGTGKKPCTLCPKGFYQGSKGSKQCTRCPRGPWYQKTTTSMGARGSSKCRDPPLTKCWVSGDPHFETFDDKYYTFQGRNKYTLVEDINNGFKVVVNLQPNSRWWPEVTYVRYVTVTFGSKDLTVRLLWNKKAKVNNKAVTKFPYERTVSGLKIKVDSRYYENWIYLLTNIGLKLEWGGRYGANVFVTDSLKGKLRGLCGNFDLDESNDIQKVCGGARPGDLAKFCRDRNTRKKRQVAMDDTKNAETMCKKVGSNYTTKASTVCSILKTAIKQYSCLEDLIPKENPFHNNCVYDFCGCKGDQQCLCDSLGNFADQVAIDVEEKNTTATVGECVCKAIHAAAAVCAKHSGGKLPTWRAQDFCIKNNHPAEAKSTVPTDGAGSKDEILVHLILPVLVAYVLSLA